jgi:Flp pilus assembly protein TadG
MALVMPILILMVMGIIDFGRIFNGEIQLSQAAREGARVAALGNFTVANVIDRTKAALANPAFQGALSFGTTGAAAGCVSTPGCILVGVVPVDSVAGPAATQGTVCAATDALTGNSQVTVTIPYSKILFGPATLSQKAVMKCSG